jgi:hypothetical protein
VKRIKRVVLCTALFGPLAATALGQEWYAGAGGGYGFAPSLNVSVQNPSGSATTGFNSGYAVGAFFGTDMYSHWGGEVRYLYRQSDLKLDSGGTSTSFTANTSVLNFDFLWHVRPRESSVRPFIAFGAGMKFLDGTGTESANQPLGRFAALTHTTESLPAGDVGGGVKYNFRKSWEFRAEVRDYIGPAPQKVIAAAPGATISSWLNDVVGMASIAYRW